jgi:hypothetical protein
MRTILTALAFAIVAAATPASAQGQNSRWCADYGRSGAENCGFMTYQQCRATISGFNQGSCYLNPQFPGNWPRPRR